MNVAIVLAGLTPRAKQIDGMGFGGTPTWKFEDRVALLAGLKGPALDWAYYRYCGQGTKLLPVLRYMQSSIDLYCGINRIRIKRETRAGIVKVALMDMTSPICQECQGRGYHEKLHHSPEVQKVIGENHTCERCSGSGRVRLSGRAIAGACGIDHKSWGKTHDLLLSEAIKLLITIDHEVFNNALTSSNE